LPAIAPGAVVELPPSEIPLPQSAEANICHAEFRLIGAAGSILSANAHDLAVYPRRLACREMALDAWSPEPDIQERLVALGCRAAGSLASAELVVARRHDAELADYVRGGGRLILCPEEAMSLHPFFPHWQNVQARSRAGTLWQGDWASSFSWLDRSRLFSDLPGGPLLDMSFDKVMPRYVIGGCNLLDFQARVHAGIVVGWIHKAAALIVERAYGTGRMVASTFRLFHEAAENDPTAAVLAQRVIDLAMATPSVQSSDAASIDFAADDDGVVPLVEARIGTV
jgi:hypothetical protein